MGGKGLTVHFTLISDYFASTVNFIVEVFPALIIFTAMFHEPDMEKADPAGHSTTIFGILAIEDMPALPPDPVYRELAIEAVSLIGIC